MAEVSGFYDLLILIGAVTGVLGLFTGTLLWAVRSMVNSLKQDNKKTSNHLQDHIDQKLNGVTEELKKHAERIDGQDKKIHERELGEVRLRNEVLERMRDHYVRHQDIAEIKTQLDAIFKRVDRVIFGRGGRGVGADGRDDG